MIQRNIQSGLLMTKDWMGDLTTVATAITHGMANLLTNLLNILTHLERHSQIKKNTISK